MRTVHRRLAPVLALLLLAPWTAECSWGGFTAAGFLPVMLWLAPLYGAAAVLIRETARRTGRGWPTMVLLAAAFGVAQAGLVDQSLFNPDYLDDTEYADLFEDGAAFVPVPGFSAEQAFDFVGNHIVLSICAPIAIVEACTGRPERPWLGRPGLAGTAVLYVLGSLLIFSDSSGRKGFLASPMQLAFAAGLVVVLVGAAMLSRWRRRPARGAGRVPGPLAVGALVLAAHLTSWPLHGWPAVAVRTAAAAVCVAAVLTWSRRVGWDHRHVLAGWGAGLVSAAAGAYLVPTYEPASTVAAVTGDIAVSVVVAALLGGAAARLRISARRAPATPPVPGSAGPASS